jgi:hypothetical protein
VPCGSFATAGEGRVVAHFAVPVDAYAAPIARLLVTVEPEAATPAPTGPPVMEGVRA